MTTKEQAKEYIERGWGVIPVPRGKKGPVTDAWEDLRINPEQVEEFFVGECNIGVLLGEPSGGLADADMDCDEAEHAAKTLMPKTLISGRGSKITHHWYTSPGIKSFKFKDIDGDVIAEIRSDGLQTLVEPSTHPSGDRYVWMNAADPREIDRHDLRSAVARVAVSALIARHLPDGGRHDLALGYAALMLKPLMELGADKDEAVDYVHGVLQPAWTYHSASNEALKDLYDTIEDTAERVEAHEPAKGRAFIEESLTHGAEIVQRIKDWLGWGNLTPAQREEAEQRRRVKRAERAIADPNVSELAHDPDILSHIYRIMQDGGLVGEEKNAKLLILTTATMHTGRPQSLLLNDNSSTGKSFLLKQAIKTLPEWMVYEVQSVSNQGLAYLGETTLKGKFFCPYELGALGNKESDSLEQIKGLITEGSIVRDSVKDHAAQKLRVERPTGVLTTSTKLFMDHELSTRMFRISMTNTPEHRRAVLKARTRRNANTADYEPIRGLHTYLAGQDNRVVVPFEDELTDLVNVASERILRDHERLMDLIEAHAVLHQETRERDQDGCIVATLEDYEAVHALIADIVGEASEVAVSETVRETVNTVRELIKAGEDVTRNTLAERFGIVPTSAGRRFEPATAQGFIKEDPDNPNAKPKRYVLGDVPLPENTEVIPSPEKLRSCVSASGARGVAVDDEDHMHEASGDARSDARCAHDVEDSVMSEERITDTYSKSGEHHEEENTENALSPERTHARTMFIEKSQATENTRTVHAPVRDVVRVLRNYLEHESPVRPRDWHNVDLWLWNLADNGYGEFPEEAIEEALYEYGDEIFEGVR